MNSSVRSLVKTVSFGATFPCLFTDGLLRVSVRGCVYSAALLFFYITFNLTSFFYTVLYSKQTPLHAVVSKLFFVVRIILLLYNTKNYRSINRYLKKVKKIGASLLSVGFSQKFTRHKNHLKWEILLFFTYASAMVLINFYKGWLFLMYLFFIIFEGFTICTNTTLITFFIGDAAMRFETLIAALKSIDSTVFYEGKVLKLKALSQAHGRLCKESEFIHEAFQMQILSLTVFLFMNVIINVYSVINLLTKTSFSRQFMVFGLIKIIYYSRFCYCMVTRCSVLSKKVGSL